MFVTHDQGEALSMADRVAVFNHGRIEQLDTPRALYTVRDGVRGPLRRQRERRRPELAQRLTVDAEAFAIRAENDRVRAPRP